MESTANSDTCLADVMATRNATMQDRKHKEVSLWFKRGMGQSLQYLSKVPSQVSVNHQKP